MSYFTLGVGIGLSLLLFIPAYLGIRFGAAFATVLGLLSMIPLTILAVAPFFTGDMHGGNLDAFTTPGRFGFFSGALLVPVPAVLRPPHVERDRDGGGGLLPGRVPESGP